MSGHRLVVCAVLFSATLALVVFAPSAPVEAQTKGKGTKAATPPKFNAFKVQVRHPGWRRIPVANVVAARNLAVAMKLAGWTTVQIRQPRSGVLVVRAKMPRWQNRAVLTNRAVAEVLASQGRLQGFQARVVPFRR